MSTAATTSSNTVVTTDSEKGTTSTDDDEYNIIGYESALLQAEREQAKWDEECLDTDEENLQKRMRNNNTPFKQPYWA
jgi:hypothetical protein